LLALQPACRETRAADIWKNDIMTKQLTAAAVERLRPGRERREIRDGGAAGLYLTIQTSGAKSFTMRFRRPDGRPAKLTLGSADLSGNEPIDEPVLGGPLTLAGARRLAAEINRRRALGRDVVADHAADKQRRRVEADKRINTFRLAAREFVESHARTKTRRWRETAKLLGFSYAGDSCTEASETKGGLAIRWRDRPIEEIDGHDIYSVIDESRRRGIPGTVARNGGASDPRGRVMARTLSKMFAWLVQHRRLAANPCSGVWCPPAPPARERVLNQTEIRLLWSACEQVGEPFGPLFRLLLLTGARLNEVARMTWHEISEDGMTWNLTPSRTKNKRPHVVPLSPAVREILAGLRRITGKPGYLFTTNGRTPVSGFSKIKARLDGLMLAEAGRVGGDHASIPAWRLHDLRRTCATGMADHCRIPPHIVEAALNHVSGAKAGVAGIYNRALYADEKRAALECWAVYVQTIVRGGPTKVVPMRLHGKQRSVG
jgi:integrase